MKRARFIHHIKKKNQQPQRQNFRYMHLGPKVKAKYFFEVLQEEKNYEHEI